MSISKKKKCKINNLIFYLNTLEKEEQTEPKARRRRKEIIDNKVEINNMENSKAIEQINKIKNTFFENIKKIDVFIQTDQEKKKTEITKL